MQVVIPMSGFGERFRRAGYTVPKPLIMVDGKPIIGHVIDLFPGETDFLFICNREHLGEPRYAMAEMLSEYCPTGRVVSIDPHREGPIGAIRQARKHIDPDRPMFVNYCDFNCFWDWADFKRFVAETECDGAVPAYRGFHPHSLHGNNYAFLRETGGWLNDIQEKQPWTDDRLSELASSGGYYFATGGLGLDLFDEVVDRDMKVGGEFYVSLAYKVLTERQARIAVYELQHFMQWGTPEDLAEYLGWSSVFRRLAFDESRRARQSGTVLVPMAGYGTRFADEGYGVPKAMVPVSGRPMVIQATRDLPDAPRTRFVVRRDLEALDDLLGRLRTSFVGASALVLDEGTDGQASTCRLGVADINADEPLTIGACDNAMIYGVSKFEALMAPGGPDVLIWVVRGHADGRLRPCNFGWVDVDAGGRVRGVRVKEEPDDPSVDPMIVGAFSFRRADDFTRAYESLVDRDGRVNGEFYVDSLIEDAVKLGLDCRIFEIDHYLGWGTPNDLRTFEYWQSCFHKWTCHPYRLEKDQRVPTAKLRELDQRYAAIPAPRPEGVAVKTASNEDLAILRWPKRAGRCLTAGHDRLANSFRATLAFVAMIIGGL
ncbi:MAG: NTP transferase domain-containing protein [Sphingomicrobium sp.]